MKISIIIPVQSLKKQKSTRFFYKSVFGIVETLNSIKCNPPKIDFEIVIIINGKTDTELIKYISENLIYPDSAYKANMEGKVFVSFTIDCEGHISNIKITKGSNPYFDTEVLRLISNMPNWIWDEKIKPTERMTITRTLPISFKLK